MFNFDTTFTKGKHTFKIVNNEIVEGRENLSAVNGNALIRHWVDTVIKPQLLKANPSKDFDSLVKESQYLQEALSRVNYIKALNCSYGNKDKENIENEMSNLGTKFFEKIKLENFTPAQQIVIRAANERDSGVSTYNIQGLYNPVTNDDSKLQEWWKGLNEFDYEKYDYSLNLVTDFERDTCYATSPKSCYQNVLQKIEHFQTILKEAGDDLVNWTDQKISLRFTKLGIKAKAYEICEYTSAYKEHLLANGIKKKIVKANTSKGKLEELVKNGTATQDDLFRYYKQEKYAHEVLPKFDLEHLYLIIDSELKCVTEKLYVTTYGSDRPSLSEEGNKIAKLLCTLSKTEEDYKKIFNWAGALVTLDFMIKHKDHSTTKEVISYCSHHANTPIGNLVDGGYYKTCLTKIPDEVKFKLSKGLTYQYMVRMTDTEKVTMLNRIAKEAILLEYPTLYGLYQDVDYKLIKKTILRSKDLMKHLSRMVVDVADHEAMVKICKETAAYLSNDEDNALLTSMTSEERLTVLEHNAKEGRKDFTQYLENLTDSESLTLLKNIMEDSRTKDYVEGIFEHFSNAKRVRANSEANKIVRAIENVDAFPKDSLTIGCLLTDTKIEFLKKGIDLKTETDYHRGYSYGGSNNVKKVSDSIGRTFFSDFKREDILKVFKEEDLTSCEYAKFLGHLMTKEELEACVIQEITYWNNDTENFKLQDSFLRYNLELLSYGFLKRFKDKYLFRIVVGDRRNTSNGTFGLRLLGKLKVNNSIDFMFAD